MYTKREVRVLYEIAAEIEISKRCTLSHCEIAERAGVSRSTVRAAIMKAEAARDFTVTRRTVDGETNVILFPSSREASATTSPPSPPLRCER